NALSVYDTSSGRRTFHFQGKKGQPDQGEDIYRVAFSRAGLRLAAASTAGWVKMWSLTDSREVSHLQVHQGPRSNPRDSVKHLTFSVDERLRAWMRPEHYWDERGRHLDVLRLQDLEKNQESELVKHVPRYGAPWGWEQIAFSADGRRFAGIRRHPPAEKN